MGIIPIPNVSWDEEWALNMIFWQREYNRDKESRRNISNTGAMHGYL